MFSNGLGKGEAGGLFESSIGVSLPGLYAAVLGCSWGVFIQHRRNLVGVSLDPDGSGSIRTRRFCILQRKMIHVVYCGRGFLSLCVSAPAHHDGVFPPTSIPRTGRFKTARGRKVKISRKDKVEADVQIASIGGGGSRFCSYKCHRMIKRSKKGEPK